MEVGRSFEEVWVAKFRRVGGFRLSGNLREKVFVLFFFCLERGRKSGRHFIFIFVWKRKR